MVYFYSVFIETATQKYKLNYFFFIFVSSTAMEAYPRNNVATKMAAYSLERAENIQK